MPTISRQRKRQPPPQYQSPQQQVSHQYQQQAPRSRQKQQYNQEQQQQQHQQQQTPHQSHVINFAYDTSKTKKSPSISFNIGRIMPKNIAHDKQHLYEQNMKLRQQLQIYKNQVIKLKTKLNVSQKQVQKVVGQWKQMQQGSIGISIGRNGGYNYSSNRAIMRRNCSMTQHTNIQTQAYMKKLLRQSKQAQNILLQQNTKLKKLVKYTQISQLRIHNEQLVNQCTRLARIIQSKVLDQNQYVEQYEQQIREIKGVLEKQRENNRYVYGQVEGRDKRIKELEKQVYDASIRENKMKRQIAEFRKAIKQNNNNNTHNNNTHNNNSKRHSKQSQTSTQKQCKKCQQLEQQLKYYRQRAQQLQVLINNSNMDNKSIVKIDTSQPKSQAKSNINISHRNNNNNNSNNNNGININGTDGKDKGNKQQENDQEYGSQQFADDQQKQQEQQQQNQYSDDFQKDQKANRNNSYQQQFDDIQDEDGSQTEQILFSKNNNNNKNNKKDKQKKEKAQNSKNKNNKSNIKQNNQQQQLSLQQIVKQTIAYRLRAQGYSYQALTSDIKQSNLTEFTASQLATMLSQQPFFLVDDQLLEVLTYIFGHSDLHMEEKVKSKDFLKRIKMYCIGEIPQFQPDQIDQIQEQCSNLIQKNNKKLLKKFKQSSTSTTISKQKFTQILTSQGLTPKQVDYLLGYASLVSKSLHQIDYQQFLSRVSK